MRGISARQILRWVLYSLAIVTLSLSGVRVSAQEPQGEANGQKWLLRYKFRTNQFVHYDVASSMRMKTQLGEATETVTNKSSARKHYRIVSVNEDGQAILEMVLERVEMSAQFGDNEPTTYDSTSSSPPPKKFVKVDQAVGKPQARIQFAANGTMLKVLPLTGVSAQDAATIDPSQNFLVVFPTVPVAVGQTWNDYFHVDVNVTPRLKKELRLRRKYELVSVKGNKATISMKTSVLSPVTDPSILGQLVQRSPSGNIVFDLERGLILSREQKVEDSVIGPFGPKSAMEATSHLIEKLVVNPKATSEKE